MSDTDEIPDKDRLGRHTDQIIRRMIREEIARHGQDKPIRPYPVEKKES